MKPRNTAATIPAPTAATDCAVRQPASSAIAPPMAGPAVWPISSPEEKTARERPRASRRTAREKKIIPVVLAIAEAIPITNAPVHAAAVSCAPASTTLPAPIRTPAPA